MDLLEQLMSSIFIETTADFIDKAESTQELRQAASLLETDEFKALPDVEKDRLQQAFIRAYNRSEAA